MRGENGTARPFLRAMLLALFAGAIAISCEEGEQPDCTADEAEACAGDHSTCLAGIVTDTDTDTQEEVDSEGVCDDDYCSCLESAGCEWAGCGGTDTGA